VKNQLESIDVPKNFKGDAKKHVLGKQQLVLRRIFSNSAGPKYADPMHKFRAMKEVNVGNV
jgi:hypothetical protein